MVLLIFYSKYSLNLYKKTISKFLSDIVPRLKKKILFHSSNNIPLALKGIFAFYLYNIYNNIK